MNKKKMLTMAGGLALVAAIGIGSSLAYFTDKAEAENTITTGHVSITLDEPKFSENNKDNTITNVRPNQQIEKDPTITVKADSESAYLRAKIEYKGLSNKKAAELEEQLNIQAGWVKAADGYYYFQYPVTKTGEDQKFVLFDMVTIPKTWGNEVEDLTMNIIVKAEAIQADYFEPVKVGDTIIGWANAEIDPLND